MAAILETRFSKLKGSNVSIANDDAYPEPGQASVSILFSDGTKLKASYWRLIKDGMPSVSSFDHQQKYGFPTPIDAKEELKKEVNGKSVIETRADQATGDLFIVLANKMKLQVFNFTGYEIWELSYPDGTTEYSNRFFE